MKLKHIVACVAVLGVLFIALPPIERRLLEQPSCFAFIGMKQPFFVAAGDEELRDPFNRAVQQGALHRPPPPYVIVTLTGGEADFENVIVAAQKGGQWEVTEAGRPWKMSTQKLLDFQPLPTRMLGRDDGKRLEELLSKSCLYGEPRSVDINPDVHFSLIGPGQTFDATIRVIDVNNGARSHIVVQGRPAGINGAVGNIVAQDASGFVVID